MTVVTRCQILRLKCTKFDFGWGSAPDPAGGAYCAPPDPLAGLKGPTSKGREGRGWEGEGMGGRRGKGRGDLLQGLRGDRRPWSGESVELVLEKKSKAVVGRICRKGRFKPGMKEWRVMNDESGGSRWRNATTRIIPRMVMRYNSNINIILNFDDDDCY